MDGESESASVLLMSQSITGVTRACTTCHHTLPVLYSRDCSSFVLSLSLSFFEPAVWRCKLILMIESVSPIFGGRSGPRIACLVCW